jgi:hypothetical protein
MAVQLCVTSAAVGAVILAFRSTISHALKAAILSVGIVLATPYVFAYDLPVLAVAIGFLHREHKLETFEVALLAVSAVLVVFFLFVPLPTGLLASVAVTVLAGRRWRACRDADRDPLSAQLVQSRNCAEMIQK